MASRARVEEGLKSHVELYDALMSMFGRRPRPPYTTHHLASVLAALAEGFAIQDVGGEHQHLDRPDLGEGVGSGWTLFGTATQAVIEHFTERCSCAAVGWGRPVPGTPADSASELERAHQKPPPKRRMAP